MRQLPDKGRRPDLARRATLAALSSWLGGRLGKGLTRVA
jgi:hypothetical protein